MEKYYAYRIKMLTCPSCGLARKVKWQSGPMFVEQRCGRTVTSWFEKCGAGGAI